MTVSQRSLQTPGRVKQTVTSPQANDMNNMMNHVNDNDGIKPEAEEMDTDHDGMLRSDALFMYIFSNSRIVQMVTH